MTATVNIICAKDGTVLASNVVTDAYTCPNDVVTPPPPSFIDVKAKGAKGDGSSDDTAALAAAAAEAVGKSLRLYFPSGVYRVSAWTPPEGLDYYGDGAASHIKGKVTFGKHQTATSLKLGADGVSISSSDGAHACRFVKCELVGGPPTIALPNTRTAYDIRFDFCTINPNKKTVGNAVAIVHMNQNHYYKDIVFSDCTFKGASRMTVEILERGDSSSTMGYSNLSFYRCVFEPGDSQAISYDGSKISGNSVVEGCTFLGSGLNPAVGYAHHIEVNGPKGMVVRGNKFLRCPKLALNIHGSTGSDVSGRPLGWLIVENNVFDMTQGVATRLNNQLFSIGGSGTILRNNQVLINMNGPVIYVHNGPNLIEGNVVRDTRSSSSGSFVQLAGAPDTVVRNNQFVVHGQYVTVGAGSSGSSFTGNLFDTGRSESALFRIASGVTIERADNRYE